MRFHVYARRVKLLLWIDYSDLEPGPPVSDVWSPVFALLAESLPVPHFFPNLKEIFWGVRGRDYLAFVNLFLAPQLETISIGDLATDAHLTILPTLPTRCPRLRCVTITTLPDLSMRHGPMSTMIHALPRIVELNIESIDQPSFEYLAQLPTLASLDIRNGPYFLPLPAPAESPKFPSLREITLASTPYAFLPAFFTLKGTWTLRRITMTTSSAPSASEIARLYALVAACCDCTTLHTLTLRTSSSAEAIPAAQIADSVIQPDCLRPLFSFRNLRQICLHPPAGFDLDDTAVADLAHAWPTVRSLQLCGGAYRRPPSRVTFSGIRALARDCHYLHFVVFPFNALVVPRDDGGDAPLSGGTLSQVLWFDVHDTPVVDPAPVAAYMFHLFPRLREISTARWEHVPFELLERADALHQLWKQVKDLLPIPTAMIRDAGQ